MITLFDAKKQIENILTKAGVDSPAFETLCLIEKVCGISNYHIFSDKKELVDDDKFHTLNTLAQKRIKGEPLQYLLGEWEFYGYKLKVGKGVLIPRDDTEVLLRKCLEILKNKSCAKVLDLCSGTGALAIAISKETNAQVTAVEKSEEALKYLNENVKLNNADVKVCQGDIFTCMNDFNDREFDLVLSNPPYIKTDDIKTLQTEISYEPAMALDGGKDGYDFYRHIITHWTSKLKVGGTLAFEIGECQFDTIKSLMEGKNYENISGDFDLSGIQRTVYGTLV